MCQSSATMYLANSFQDSFLDEGIDTSFLFSDEDLPSGVALITVDKMGENSIVVAAGAYGSLHSRDIQGALQEIANASMVLLQLEVPMEVVEFVVDYAYKNKVKVILNPAPVNELSEELLQKVDILTPNKTEAGMISGITVEDIESAKEAARLICKKGVKDVVITMGPLGAVVLEKGEFTVVPATPVETVDTTAAGDVFNGALAVGLSEGRTMQDAVAFACEAAALSVTRLGAQSSIPSRHELLARKLDIASFGNTK